MKFALACVAVALLWLALTLPLIVAAMGRTRMSTKVGALLALAGVFVVTLIAVTMAWAMNDDAAPVPAVTAAGLIIAYLATAFVSVRRKPF